MLRHLFIGSLTVAALFGATSASAADPAVTARAQAFVAAHVSKFRPLDITAGKAWWDANTTGKDEDFKKKEEAQNKIDAALSDKTAFAELKAIKEAKDKGAIEDKLLARSVDVLYLTYLEKQVDPELLKKITAKSNVVEQKFNVFRPVVNGNEITDSAAREILKKGTESAQRKAVWEAGKKVGANVETDLKELVKLRNEAATQLGFKNFHALTLFLNEQDGVELVKLFDELDELTREPFLKAKAEIDERLAKIYDIKPADLAPWHYHDPFFQESPAVFDADLDAPYKKADILKLCSQFYAGIGLPIDDVIARSDLYEKKGKSPHAFCTDIDREGDVRVLANIVPNEYWMGTMLHELGHSVYSSKNIPQSVPYVLRSEAHILTTEGVAMQFERFGKSRAWLEKMGVAVDNPEAFAAAAKKVQRNQLLIFSRWCQVMLRFEKGMYENPDQDLNALWWGLVEKYQGLKKPAGRNAPDYGSKIHICSAPVYYHNYMMGQLFASQVHHTIARELFNDADPNAVIYIGDRRVGEFMKKKVFEPARTVTWRELTKNATGEELGAKAFAKDFQGK
ncbi:Peptidyl-dipeptidase A precursor [Fimbriiglobus ruber]|uniref:Peptidyl-dipeptidase A n=1 Tax=Fimbriiglobus ruber TaxID=1908690 RepID=A0A225DVU8_9BACT|nr:Peptidyl-dipeptidase A precursor [Fimbriiglobus ruber]